MSSFPGLPDAIDLLLWLGFLACVAASLATSALALVIARARRALGWIALLLALSGGACVAGITVKQWPAMNSRSPKFVWMERQELLQRRATDGAITAAAAGVAALLVRCASRSARG
jgi:hypothetical protein